MARKFVVYLSSTLDDLLPERRVAEKLIDVFGVHKSSYQAKSLRSVDACLEDVRSSHLYIGILGKSYGSVPSADAGGAGGKSFTELEYEACREGMVEHGMSEIPRLMFLKSTEAGIPEKFIDGLNGRDTKPKMDAFLTRARNENHCFEFKSLDQFETILAKSMKEEIDRIEEEIVRGKKKEAQEHSGTILWPPQPTRGQLTPVRIGCVKGTDADQVDALAAMGAAGPAPFELGPEDSFYLATLDAELSRAQNVALLVTTASLPRLTLRDRVDMVSAALDMLHMRTGRALLLCEGLEQNQLPQPWQERAEVHVLPTGALSSNEGRSVVADLQRQWSGLGGSMPRPSQVALPYMVIAPIRAEVAAMKDAGSGFFDRFGDAREWRKGEFLRLLKALQADDGDWPRDIYGDERHRWRCFGAQSGTAEQIIQRSVDRINRAPQGSRIRSMLGVARLTPRRYCIEEYLHDRWGSRQVIEAARDRPFLILVDELALLNPELRSIADHLCTDAGTAVAAISPCDPNHTPIDKLVADLSYLRVGNLVSRFQANLDPRCELAVNSINRLDRWLSATIPGLVMGEQELAQAHIGDIARDLAR